MPSIEKTIEDIVENQFCATIGIFEKFTFKLYSNCNIIMFQNDFNSKDLID